MYEQIFSVYWRLNFKQPFWSQSIPRKSDQHKKVFFSFWWLLVLGILCFSPSPGAAGEHSLSLLLRQPGRQTLLWPGRLPWGETTLQIREILYCSTYCTVTEKKGRIIAMNCLVLHCFYSYLSGTLDWYADFVLSVKCTTFWLNRDCCKYLDLYAPAFSKSNS